MVRMRYRSNGNWNLDATFSRMHPRVGPEENADPECGGPARVKLMRTGESRPVGTAFVIICLYENSKHQGNSNAIFSCDPDSCCDGSGRRTFRDCVRADRRTAHG